MMLVVSGFARLASAQTAPNPTPTSDAQPLAVLLEQGIYQEETAGNLDAAAKTYQQIADQAAVGRSLVAQALARLAALQVKQKHLDEARQTIARLKTEYPEQKDAIAKAAALLPGTGQKPIIAGGDHGERPQESEHVPTAEEKTKAAELAKQGWEQYRDGQNESATETFRRAIELDPKSIDALNGLGWTLLNQNRVGAGQYFGKVLELDPKNAKALNGMGWTLWQQSSGSKPNAIKYWQQAVEADLTATAPIAGLAQYALQENQFDEAVKWYEKWLSLEPKDAQALRGAERAKQGQQAVAEAMPTALEFLKYVDEDQLDDAKRLTASDKFELRNQVNTTTWISVLPSERDLPRGFSKSKTENWNEMMKELRGAIGPAIGRKVESLKYLWPIGRTPADRTSPYSGRFGFTKVEDTELLRYGNAAGTILIRFATEFDNKRHASETVKLNKSPDGGWKIAGYGITNPVAPRDPLKSQ